MNITQISHRARTIALSLFSLTLLCSSPSHSTKRVLDHEQEDKPSFKPFTYKNLNVQINSEDGKHICSNSKWAENERLVNHIISNRIVDIECYLSTLARGGQAIPVDKLRKQDGTFLTYQEYYHYLHVVRKRMCYEHLSDDVPVTPAAVPITRKTKEGSYMIDVDRIPHLLDFIVVWTAYDFEEDEKLRYSTIHDVNLLIPNDINDVYRAGRFSRFQADLYGIHQVGYKLYSSRYTYHLRENLKDPNDQTRAGLDRFLAAALSDDFMALLQVGFTLDFRKAGTIINFPNQIFVEDITAEQLINNQKVFMLAQLKKQCFQESMASIVETLLCTSDLPCEIQELVINQTLCLIYRRYMENLRASKPKVYECYNTIEKTFQDKAS